MTTDETVPLTTTQLFDTCHPKVRSGDTLTITMQQTLQADLMIEQGTVFPAQHIEVTGPNAVEVLVHGPRCLLGPDDIVGQYPAPGSKDSPAEFLCHVALRRRTLPWERLGPRGVTPWLALLLVKESELSTGAPGSAPGAALERIDVGQLATTDAALHKLLTDPAGAGPAFENSDQIHVARLLRSTLTAILPIDDELGPLCHMKRVTPGTPADCAMVIGNRLPTVNPDGSAELHTALLVSLERRTDLYDASGSASEVKGADVRTPVIVLHHWSFTPSGGGDFENVMQEIRLRPNGGVLRFGNRPLDASASEPAPLGGGFQALLDAGGYPTPALDFAQHDTAVYRGPLQPFPAPPRGDGIAIRAAPAEFGTKDAIRDDYSYAAAFELGRLLALHDEGILEDLRSMFLQRSLRVPAAPVQLNTPAALRTYDWVVGWPEHQWDMTLEPGEAVSVVQDHGALHKLAGSADPLGLAAITGVREAVQAQLEQLAAPAIEVSLFDIQTVDVATLPDKFAILPAAGKSGP